MQLLLPERFCGILCNMMAFLWCVPTYCLVMTFTYIFITWRKKSNRVTDFHGNTYNSISFVLWSWNRQRIVSLTSNYGFKKAWVTWHMVMYVQFLLCQTTFASRKKNWFLSENEIRWRKVANGRIYWADASIWKDKAIYKHLSVSHLSKLKGDLQLLLLY